MEGSNTLTRSLIIFGQGLNKSHPYIHEILDNVLIENVEGVTESLRNIIGHSLKLYIYSFNIKRNNLEQQIIDFAALTNFVALKGGLLKKEQMLSGAMADIFSNLYLALSVKNYHENYQTSEKLTQYIIQKLMNENQLLINKVIDNLGFERYLLLHLKKSVKYDNFEEERQIFQEIMDNPNIVKEIKKNIHIKDNILADLERVNQIENKNSLEYTKLAHRIINVDEFKC